MNYFVKHHLLRVLMILTTFYSGSVTTGTVQISINPQYDGPQLCADQQLEYHCTGNDSSLAVVWMIYESSDDNVASFIGSSHGSLLGVVSNATISGGLFSVDQNSSSRLISKLSFKSQLMLNGYLLVCTDILRFDENRTIINVSDNPGDVIIHTDTFTNSSVNISWTESPPYCNTTYMCNVSSSALEENIVMVSTSNNAMVENLVPSDDQYCIVVTAMDQFSNRSSNKSCFILDFPRKVELIYNEPVKIIYEESYETVSINVTWKKPDEDSLITVMPDLIAYNVIIEDNNSDFKREMRTAPPTAYTYTFTGIPVNTNYTVTVIGTNGVGDSQPTSQDIVVEVKRDKASCPSTSLTVTAAISSSVSIIVTIPLTAIFTIIIMVIIMYKLEFINRRKSPLADREQATKSAGLEVDGNLAYGQVKHDYIISNRTSTANVNAVDSDYVDCQI